MGGGFFWHTAVVGLGTHDSSEGAVVFVIIDRDELLDSATAEVLEGTCVDVPV